MHVQERYYIVVCGLSGSVIFFHIISQMARFPNKRLIEHEMCFDFLYNVFVKYFYF